MTTQSRLRELGIPALEGQASLFYQIGTAAITFAILILLTLPLVGFSRSFVFSFSWILSTALVVLYLVSRVNILLVVGTAVALIVLTFVATMIGSPFHNTFSLIIFLVCLAGGWFMQHQGLTKQGIKQPIKTELTNLLYSPLSYTAFLLSKFNLIDENKE